ncbi:MAG: acyl-CoA dehydrogenase family protein [Rhodocyclaceae bacterium]|nr:acyl-CoA dehydrogenase family protein [Rhodocyclaceae bacterium]
MQSRNKPSAMAGSFVQLNLKPRTPSMSTDSWELSEELRQIRDTVSRFMTAEVKPAEDKLVHDAYELPADLLAPLQQKAREIGLWCVRSPVEYGGAGLSLLGQAMVAEEAAKCRMGAYVPACGVFGADPPNAIFLGTPEQISKYAVPSVAQGRKVYVAISEASGGADPARSIRTRAVRKGDRYILNGTKMWITAADGADWGLVFARTGEQGDRGGMSCFIVNGLPKGMSLKPIPVIRSYSPYEIHFDNVEVPVEDRLGEEGQGFAVCEKWLVEGRVPYAAGTIGIAQAALQIAIDWARSRETFRTKLADKQAVQWMIADSEMELRAARLLVYQAAWQGDLGRDLKVDSSIAKVVATETAGRVVDRCIQVLGALGVSQELPLERWYRELRIKRIGEGPSEVHRMVLARHLLGAVR